MEDDSNIEKELFHHIREVKRLMGEMSKRDNISVSKIAHHGVIVDIIDTRNNESVKT